MTNTAKVGSPVTNTLFGSGIHQLLKSGAE